MWTCRTEELTCGGGLRIAVDLDSSPVSYSEVLRRWQVDAEFRAFFIGLLGGAPFSAFRWETPPVTSITVARPFEFVWVQLPILHVISRS